MNTNFGLVRSNINRQDDLDYYAMATGNLEGQIASQQRTVDQNKSAHSAANISYVTQYEKVNGGYCARIYSGSNKRKKCQADQNAWLITYKNRLATALLKLQSSQVQLQSLRDQHEAETQAQIEAIDTLAQQGLTPEAVLEVSQAQAQSILLAQEASKKRLIITLIFIGVALTAFVIVRMVRKKRQPNA